MSVIFFRRVCDDHVPGGDQPGVLCLCHPALLPQGQEPRRPHDREEEEGGEGGEGEGGTSGKAGRHTHARRRRRLVKKQTEQFQDKTLQIVSSMDEHDGQSY